MRRPIRPTDLIYPDTMIYPDGIEDQSGDAEVAVIQGSATAEVLSSGTATVEVLP